MHGRCSNASCPCKISPRLNICGARGKKEKIGLTSAWTVTLLTEPIFFCQNSTIFCTNITYTSIFWIFFSYFCVIFLFCPGSSEPGRWNAALYFKSQNDYLIPQISHVICSYQGFPCHLTHVYFSRWYFIIWKIIFLS